MIQLGLSFQKIVLEWFYDNWLRSYNGSKLQEDKFLKNRNFSVFWNTKISEISESENFDTQGLHLMYLRPPGGGNSNFFRESRPTPPLLEIENNSFIFRLKSSSWSILVKSQTRIFGPPPAPRAALAKKVRVLPPLGVWDTSNEVPGCQNFHSQIFQKSLCSKKPKNCDF